MTMLLATLVVLCGLVLVMRAMLADERLSVRMNGALRYGAGMLDFPQLVAAVDAEHSRAARHDAPAGARDGRRDGVRSPRRRAAPDRRRRIVTAMGRAVVEPHPDRGQRRPPGMPSASRSFAPETTSAGAAALAGRALGVVRERLLGGRP